MSLLDILGNYYDSACSNYVEMPHKMDVKVTFGINTGFDHKLPIEMCIEYKGISKRREYVDNSSHTNFLKYLNDFIPNFYCTRGNLGENFECYCKELNKTFYAPEGASLHPVKLIKEYVQKIGHVPLTFSFNITVTRHENKELRRRISLDNTEGKSAQDWFATITNPEATNLNPRSKWARRSTFTRGGVKDSIISKSYKIDMIFMIECLYGVKLPKNSTVEKIFTELARQPRTDFGIKEVNNMKSFLEKVRYINTKESALAEFPKLGFQPRTDLKRW